MAATPGSKCTTFTRGEVHRDFHVGVTGVGVFGAEGVPGRLRRLGVGQAVPLWRAGQDPPASAVWANLLSGLPGRGISADVRYTLHPSDSGTIRIAAHVIATIAREAARTVPGVRAAFGRSTHNTTASPAGKVTPRHHHPHAAAGVLGRTAVVDFAIAAHYGTQLDAIAHQVQQRAIAELRAKAGLHYVTVNVTIDDVIT
jgi:uncharacterized alkaline shock family protein YloU